MEPPANYTSDDDLNLQAYNELLLFCQKEVVFGIINEADGSAKDAWEGLKTKFEPRNGAMKVQLKREFQQMKLDEDEALLFQDSEHLQRSVDELPPAYSRDVSLSDGVADRLLESKAAED